MDTMVRFLTLFYTIFFVAASLLIALFCLFKPIRRLYKLFCIFVVILSIMEITGNAIGFFSDSKNNHFWFNIVYCIEFVALPLFYSQWLKHRLFRAFLRRFPIGFLLFCIFNTLWLQDFSILQTFNFVLGGSVVLICCVQYLFELYKNEEERQILNDPVFWISLAYLIYFAVSVPYFGMLNYLWKNHAEFSTLYYLVIMDGTICLFNILLMIGLLWMKPMKQY